MKAQEGEPLEQLEAEIRRLLNADAFRELELEWPVVDVGLEERPRRVAVLPLLGGSPRFVSRSSPRA
jgi:hypothetical protein